MAGVASAQEQKMEVLASQASALPAGMKALKIEASGPLAAKQQWVEFTINSANNRGTSTHSIRLRTGKTKSVADTLRFVQGEIDRILAGGSDEKAKEFGKVELGGALKILAGDGNSVRFVFVHEGGTTQNGDLTRGEAELLSSLIKKTLAG